MVSENHYPHRDELTSQQKQKIVELRDAASDLLAKYPHYDTDFSLLRWLMGWDYKIDVILPKMKYALDTLSALGVEDLTLETASEINTYIRSLSQAAEYYPGGLMGRDREHNVVYMQCVALTHPKTLVKCGATSELFRVCLTETELAFKLIRKAEADYGKKLGVKIVIDMDEFSMDLLFAPTLKIYLQLLTLLQDIFPDFARKIYFINCPMMMSTVYAMISPVLSKQTREKIQFLGSNWKEVIADDIGTENIYPHWGGTKPYDTPKGDLRLGGKVPEKMWYNSENNPFDNKEDMTKISISARSHNVVKIQCNAGQQMRWLFRVSSGDIDFSIEYDGEIVVPVYRCMTDYHPEFGTHHAKKDGEYVFRFDNSHGKIFGKDVKYRIQLS